MASESHFKNRMQVFKNKGKDQDVSIMYLSILNCRLNIVVYAEISILHFMLYFTRSKGQDLTHVKMVRIFLN